MLTGKYLLAEDDERLGELVVHLLLKKGAHAVEWVRDGETAFDYALASFYDVTILDWMMPGCDGLETCRRLRKAGYSGAILMLTAKDALQDRVRGLESGADDYLVKPFELEELVARLKALGRRNYARIVEESIPIDDLVLLRSSQKIRRGNEQMQLSPREFQLLDLLAQNKGQVLPRELIFDRVWGWDADVSLKTVDATIKLLRKKLGSIGKNELIHSVRGVGYKLEA